MKQHTKKVISYIASAVVIVLAATWVISKFVHFGNVEFTDNAQVQRHIVPVNSRVQGYIKQICFEEYEAVHKGDTLVLIEDADLRLALARARADYANALAGKGITDRAVGVASANVAVSAASIEEARVALEMAQNDYERYTALLAKDAVTRQQYDRARTDYLAANARYDMLVRGRQASTSVEAETRERLTQNEAAIELAKALVETAELNLSYAVITAPCDGVTSRKLIQAGQLVQPGQTLLDMVNTDKVWVSANFKETQLKHIHPGSEVEIEVDAVPGVRFHGTVVSISTATGAQLSVFPQDNSAGNFVKVRQRVPVRIEFTAEDNEPADLAKLAAGMNVECYVKY